MSPLKADDLHRIFKQLDKDGDGLVSVDELKRLFERIGVHATTDEVQSLVGMRSSLDSIDFFFFYDVVIKKNTDESKAIAVDNNNNIDCHLVQAFQVFDLNGDGFISSDELRSVLSRFGLLDEHGGGGPDCKSMIKMYDQNCDGKLDLEEFKNMMFPPNSYDL